MPINQLSDAQLIASNTIEVLQTWTVDYLTIEPGDGSSTTDADYRVHLTRDLEPGHEGTFVSLYNKANVKFLEVPLDRDIQINAIDTMVWLNDGKRKIYLEFHALQGAVRFAEKVATELHKLHLASGWKHLRTA